MRSEARQRAREEREAERRVQEAFDRYLDYTVERLMGIGIEPETATEAVFNAVTMLAEMGELPPFPCGNVSYQVMGKWLVAAADLGFTEFMVEAASE